MKDIINAYTTLGHPAAFSGIGNVARETGLSKKYVIHTLNSIPTYTIKRGGRKPKHYNPYYVWKTRKNIQIDLVDYASPKLQSIVRANNGYKYLFCVIDGFSRYAWVEPMKDKREQTCITTFNKILKDMIIKPQRVISDRGSEFTSQGFKQNLKSLNIKPIYANYKAGTVERFQRSLQSLITKYQKYSGSKKCIDKLPLILQTYNNRRHRIIAMSPTQAEQLSNKKEVIKSLKKYYQTIKQKKPKFQIGDKVRVQTQKGAFGRGYDDIFTHQIFNISNINRTVPIPMYSLTTFDGEENIIARFYADELQAVTGFPFEITNIIKRIQTSQGIIRFFVKLKVDNKYLFAWIKSSDLVET